MSKFIGEFLVVAMACVYVYVLLCMAPGLEALIIEAKHLN